MQLAEPFIRIPFDFDAKRLAEEVAQFGPNDWRPHPQGNPGNSALPLIARNGSPLDDHTFGRMRPTQHLARCPYIRQVMATLNATLGRSRLMRLDGHAEAIPHVDFNYYWLQRVRVHVPVVTFPEVRFLCGDQSTYMGPGECWIFDNWREHNVLNPTPHERTHLVIDTVGSSTFWRMTEDGTPIRDVPFNPAIDPPLAFESVNFPGVMTPWELNEIWAEWMADAYDGPSNVEAIDTMRATMQPILRDWRGTWARYGANAEGGSDYMALLGRLRGTFKPLEGTVKLPNSTDLANLVIAQLVPAMYNAERLNEQQQRDERVPHPA